MSVTIDDIDRVIMRAHNINVALYQKSDLIEHTGLALIINGVGRFTIDYGAYEGLTKQSKAIGGKIGKVLLDVYRNSHKNLLVVAELEKDEVIPFVESCLQRTQTYHLREHNCRNFVVEVVEELKSWGKVSDAVWIAFLDQIKRIESNDREKINGLKGAAIGAGIGTAVMPIFGTLVFGGLGFIWGHLV